MIDLRKQEIQFGCGDVGGGFSFAGTPDAPIGKVVFRNQSPRKIRGLAPDEDLGPIKMHTIHWSDMFTLSFSNPESIDAVISILERLKEATFGEDSSYRDAFIRGTLAQKDR